jgi:putative DNA primase/helicase
MLTPGLDELERMRCEHDASAGSADSAAANWPDPVPLDAGTVPPFPLEALPSVLRAFVGDVARVRQVPTDLPGMMTLGVVAASVARRALVRIGTSHTEPLNLYVAAVAASGERKSPALRDCLEPIYLVQREQQRTAEPAHRAAVERRAAQLKRLEHLRSEAAREDDASERERIIAEAEELARELPLEPIMPRLVVDDRTPERLEVDLAEQGGALLLASEEAGSLFAMAAGRYARDGGDQTETLLKAYDGGRIDTHRITRALVVCEDPALSVVVTPQPIILERLRDHPALHHRGLLPRFAWALPASLCGERLYDMSAQAEPAVHHAYTQTMRRLLGLRRAAHAERPSVLNLHGSALAVWKKYADRVEVELGDGGRLAPIAEWASKQAGRVARIAGGWHLVETVGAGSSWCDSISPRTVERASQVGAYLEAHALRAYDVMWTDPRIRTARAVLRWLRRVTPAPSVITVREVMTVLSRAIAPDRETVAAGLAVLIEHGYLRPLPAIPSGKRAGRPGGERYAVHPFLRGQMAPDQPQNPQNSSREGSAPGFADIVALQGTSEPDGASPQRLEKELFVRADGDTEWLP